jgi:hypothetical protein
VTLSRLTLLALLALGTSCYTVAVEPVAPVPRDAPLPYRAGLSYPPETGAYTHTVRNAFAGAANAYTIPVGEMLQAQGAASLKPAFPNGSDIEIEVAIDRFDVESFQAQIQATFTVTRAGQQRFRKQYEAQGADYFLSRPADDAPRALQRTTADALHLLFEAFIEDAQSQPPTW